VRIEAQAADERRAVEERRAAAEQQRAMEAEARHSRDVDDLVKMDYGREAAEMAMQQTGGDFAEARRLLMDSVQAERHHVAEQREAEALQEARAASERRADEQRSTDLASLERMGYARADAETAMKQAGNDYIMALRILTESRRKTEALPTSHRQTIERLESHGYKLVDAERAVQSVGSDFDRAVAFLKDQEIRQREQQQQQASEKQPDNVIEVMWQNFERGWQALVGASSEQSPELIAEQERQSRQAVRDLLKDEAPQQAQERRQYLIDYLGLEPRHVDPALRAQAKMHPGRVAQTDTEAAGAVHEAIGLALEAQAEKYDIELIASDGDNGIYKCNHCSRRFHLFSAVVRHEQASSYGRIKCKDLVQKGHEFAIRHLSARRGTGQLQHQLPTPGYGVRARHIPAQASTGSRYTTLQQPPMAFGHSRSAS